MPPEKPDFQSLANDLFTTHPLVEVFYFTAGGQAFEKEHDAYNQTSRLKDKTVTEIYHPKFTATEIALRKARIATQEQVSRDQAIRSAMPELAEAINANKQRITGI